MTRDDIIQMAREADREWDCDRDMVEWLEWFAALVAAAVKAKECEVERQRIVNLLMIQHEAAKGSHNYWHVAAQLIQADVASDT